MKKLDILIVAAALILCAVLLAMNFAGAAIETANWGLCFQTKGQAPDAPEPPEKLEKYGGYYLGDPEKKTVYLTFDAGYENGCTARILDVLKKQQVPAAFFLAGNYMERNPDLVRRMAEEGHIVGNHTMHHPDMTKLKPEEFKKELDDLAQLYQSITDRPMEKFYRPPQGIYDEATLKQAQSLGYDTIFWSLAYADWDNAKQPTKEQAMAKLTDRIHNGAVILLHSTSKTNEEILDEILTKWKGMGYEFGTLSDLTQQNG